jgi:hypothetical protein
MDAQSAGRAFNDLINVGIVEGVPGRFVVIERLAAKGFGGADKADKVVDPPGFFVLLEGESSP